MKIYNTNDPFVINWDLNSLCTYNCSYCPSFLHLGNNFIYGKRKRTDEEIINAFKKCDSMSATLKELDYNWGSVGTVRKVLAKYKFIAPVT